jgi:hypothetical protein
MHCYNSSAVSFGSDRCRSATMLLQPCSTPKDQGLVASPCWLPLAFDLVPSQVPTFQGCRGPDARDCTLGC